VTTPTRPARSLFVTLPVADPVRSRAFFAELGFGVHPGFTDDDAACLLVSEQTSVMLVRHERFAELSPRPAADPAAHVSALLCFGVGSREEVDAVSAAALAAGAVEADGLEDHGFMCSRSFFDLDGHGWQVMWMDPQAAQEGPAAYAAEGAGA